MTITYVHDPVMEAIDDYFNDHPNATPEDMELFIERYCAANGLRMHHSDDGGIYLTEED
jgi:hypothetical protein